MRLLLQFDRNKEEQAIVGRLLMAYGEFEFEVARLVGYAICAHDTAARILFRVNGEGARLDVADAIPRPFLSKLGLGGQWSNAIGALRYCKNVRNQYAHCNWIADEAHHGLSFTNIDKDADSPDGILNVSLYPTNLKLLQKQHQYFEYTADWLMYLACQCRLRAGEAAPAVEVPKSISQPPLHNRQKLHARG
jgi:hypothetical protein